MSRPTLLLFVFVATLHAPLALHASDGVLEINQDCAEAQGGCFAGDAAGFPVSISARGSYRLTSDLQGASASVPLILITGEPVTLDLGGFALRGAAIGTPVSGGYGVVGAHRVAIRNGAISNMGDDGVHVLGSSRIEDLHVFQNQGDGISIDNEGIVSRCVATSNADAGIRTLENAVVTHNTAVANGTHGYAMGSGTLSSSTAALNGSAPALLGPHTAFSGNSLRGGVVSGGKSAGGNDCDDRGSCTASGRRRFYLHFDPTQVGVTGGNASTACAAGFHMASIWELREPSSFVYDSTRLPTIPFAPPLTGDGPYGPPLEFSTGGIPLGVGWMRNGNLPSTAASVGNCNGWTSSNAAHAGTTFRLTNAASNLTAQRSDPWVAETFQCNLLMQVWCVEDE